MNDKLSIIVPSIRPDSWMRLVEEIDKSLTIGTTKLDHEIIFIGPYEPLTKLASHCLYIDSFRCPSACLQEAAIYAKGNYLVWLPDDIQIEPEALLRSVNLLKHHSKKDGIIIKYSEGEGYTGSQHLWDAYWTGYTHDGLRLKQVQPWWRIAPVFMYHTEYFKEMGGLDCRFEHINMNTHDFSFRLQLDGGKLISSPTKVFGADWDPNPNRVVQLAYDENDLPLFKSIWDQDRLNRPLEIYFDNWKATDKKWKRRFV